MTRLIVDCDEAWPVWYTFTPSKDDPRERYVEVPETQLAYWDMVEREWRRVQAQMATAVCASHGHEREARHGWAWGMCLACNPETAVES